MYHLSLQTLNAPADAVKFFGPYHRDGLKRTAIWRRVVQGADMKSQWWFSLCCEAGLIFCAGGLIVSTWGKTGTPVAGINPPKSIPVNEYVDSRLCAHCHRQVYENYRQTGMAKSLFKPAPANTIEDYKENTHFYHSLSDTHYSMIFRDQAYYQRRWQIDSDGKETNVEELKIDYVMGAGDHSRAYLTAQHEER